MKVAVELPYYAHGARGASQYGENIVRALGAASPKDEFLAFTYFYRDYEAHIARLQKLVSRNVRLAVPRWSQRFVELAERRLGYALIERRLLAPERVDVFHDAGHHPVSGRPVVFTVHGGPMNLSGIHPTFPAIELPTIRRASRVICNSRCTRDFLFRHYDIDRDKVRVVHYGVDHEAFRPADAARLEEVRKRYSLPERYLLCVGPFQFRDNIELPFCVLHKDRDHALLKGVKLVLAGGLEEHGDELRRRARELGVEDRVVFAGYVPHKDLGAVYAGALAYLHPSFYEEFGAQLVEAAASGAPILASRIAGVPEILGDAPAFFNPYDIEDFEKALLRVLESEALRREMSQKSVARGRLYDWGEAARQTLEIYREAVR